MNELSLISLLIVVSVIVFVNRIYFRIKKQHFFIHKLMTKIGTFHLCFLFLIYFVYFLKPLELWIYSFSSILIIPGFIFLLTKFHQHQFCSEFLRFLSMVIIKMQMGLAFRTSYEKTLREESWKYRSLHRHIYENVTFSQQEMLLKYGGFDSFLGQILRELRAIKGYPHQSIDRLCNFRDQLAQDRFFRRKSRQIWLNFGMQLGVLSVIYWFIFIYICIQYGFKQYLSVFLASLGFYFVGLLVLFILFRRKKWHI